MSDATTVRKKEAELPDLPSDLIILAMGDEEKCFNDPHYQIEMETFWHVHYKCKNVCHVCLAGSVMAKTFKVDRNKKLGPAFFRNGKSIGSIFANECKLIALDNFRRGLIWEGMLDIILVVKNLEIPNDLPKTFSVSEYRMDRNQWRKDMFKLIDLLKQHGL